MGNQWFKGAERLQIVLLLKKKLEWELILSQIIYYFNNKIGFNSLPLSHVCWVFCLFCFSHFHRKQWFHLFYTFIFPFKSQISDHPNHLVGSLSCIKLHKLTNLALIFRPFTYWSIVSAGVWYLVINKKRHPNVTYFLGLK